MGITQHIRRNHIICNIAYNAFHVCFRCFFHLFADFFICCICFQSGCQVDYGNVIGRNTERHTCHFAFQFGDNTANGFCCPCCGRNDIVEYRTACSPVTSCSGVNCFLFCCCGVDGGHQSLFNAEALVDDFCQRCQAVCGTGCVGNDVHVWCICIFIYAHNECRHDIIFGRSCQNHFLRAAYFMQSCFFHCVESASGFHNIFSTAICPANQGSITFTEYMDMLTIYDQFVFANFNIAIKTTENTVVSQLICHIIQFCITQVDPAKFKFISSLHQYTKYHSTNSTETVNANFDCHAILSFLFRKISIDTLIVAHKIKMSSVFRKVFLFRKYTQIWDILCPIYLLILDIFCPT